LLDILTTLAFKDVRFKFQQTLRYCNIMVTGEKVFMSTFCFQIPRSHKFRRVDICLGSSAYACRIVRLQWEFTTWIQSSILFYIDMRGCYIDILKLLRYLNNFRLGQLLFSFIFIILLWLFVLFFQLTNRNVPPPSSQKFPATDVVPSFQYFGLN
jgi:hypothetical protein